MPITLNAQTFGNLGGAAADIFGAIGQGQAAKGTLASAQAYKDASGIFIKQAGIYGDQAQTYLDAGAQSAMNAKIAAEGSAITQMQQDRAIYKTLGGQRADIGGAGLAASGSALDLMRDSASQGALTMSILQNNGQLEQGGYKLEQKSYEAMSAASRAAAEGAMAQSTTALGQAAAAEATAAAQKTSSKGGLIGGILKGVGTVASIFGLFSDYRLKHDIRLQYTRQDGLRIYTFAYLGRNNQRFQGVMAQEVMELYPHAVHEDETGYLRVNYAAINETCTMVGNA